MKIRILNEYDWEKTYYLDKSIIRVGNQVSCDVQLRDGKVPALLMQIVRSGGTEVHYKMRFFSDNILLTRGDQTFPASQLSPYDILDGDKVTFDKYRFILGIEDDITRVRTSDHMRAEMNLSKSELALDSAITGVVNLTNLGTEKPCQFRMTIKGIPEECLQSAPLPYLYPGGSSSVGFLISHLRTKPAPGFYTVSITINAPDEYFGESLEFNQDIYVLPVFDNEIILEDDSALLTTAYEEPEPEESADDKSVKNNQFAKNDRSVKTEKSVKKEKSVRKEKKDMLILPPVIQDDHRLNANEQIDTEPPAEPEPIRVVGSNDVEIDPLGDNEDDDVPVSYSRARKRKDPVVVIHHDEADAFEDEKKEPEAPQEAAETSPAADDAPAEENAPDGKNVPAADSLRTGDNVPAEEEQPPAPENTGMAAAVQKSAPAETAPAEPVQVKTGKKQRLKKADAAEKEMPQKNADLPENPVEVPAPRPAEPVRRKKKSSKPKAPEAAAVTEKPADAETDVPEAAAAPAAAEKEAEVRETPPLIKPPFELQNIMPEDVSSPAEEPVPQPAEPAAEAQPVVPEQTEAPVEETAETAAEETLPEPEPPAVSKEEPAAAPSVILSLAGSPENSTETEKKEEAAPVKRKKQKPVEDEDEPVIYKRGNFPDAFFSDIQYDADSQESASQNKQQIRVMKGGSFDE